MNATLRKPKIHPLNGTIAGNHHDAVIAREMKGEKLDYSQEIKFHKPLEITQDTTNDEVWEDVNWLNRGQTKDDPLEMSGSYRDRSHDPNEHILPQLPSKQILFIDEYLIDLNATKAYQRVYNCSYQVANRNGPRLMSDANVKEEIQFRMNCRATQCSISQDAIIYHLKEVVGRCMANIVPRDNNGRALRVKAKVGPLGHNYYKESDPEENRYLPVEYAFNAIGAIKGLELLGKHIGMWQREEKPNS